ncbi:phage tail assembly chaperone [Delftia acidovorans]
MRTWAWLNAPLKPKNGKKTQPQHDEPRITRIEEFKAEGLEPDLPDPGPAGYLLEVFFDLGPSLQSPMGETPIGYEQLVAWQSIHGVQLTPWEGKTLCDLSISWLVAKDAAKDPGATRPGSVDESPEQAEERRQRVSSGLGDMLRSFRRAPK